MPRSRPQLSITLPRNFTFHYIEGPEPKTPEREIPIPVPRSPRASPRAEGPYRIKRRSRPTVPSILQTNIRTTIRSEDVPIPSIETPILSNTIRPSLQQRASEPIQPYLAPLASRKCTTLPRTPDPPKRHLANCWNDQQEIGESISRPMSVVSLMSDSSDDSNSTRTSYLGEDGSCTSPESDAPEPFKFASIRRGKAKHWASLARNSEMIQNGLSTKKRVPTRWTLEMDKHLWSIYLVYLQDPTVTPFKMLPGIPPPLGICHRVAREARQSWRGGRSTPTILDPVAVGDVLTGERAGRNVEIRPDSPDTIRPGRSGSNTPTSSAVQKAPIWPKSGGSTRRRLRKLCKRKPTFAPHYRRLMESRSPSPFSSSSRATTRSQSRLSEVSSPVGACRSPSFGTRDIQLSLTTSTADTMRPGGPLSLLATNDGPTPQTQGEWFNEPPVPFASEIPIPSDAASSVDYGNAHMIDSASIPRLGSPFGYHTWGPSRSKQRSRPSPPRFQSSDASTLGPSLKSPVRLHETFPYPGMHKRRARHQLEDELSPGGSNVREKSLENLFGVPAGGRHRRVRSRGFSLGDVEEPIPLQNLFTPPSTDDHDMTSPKSVQDTSSINAEPTTPTNQIRRLASPFEGITPRPVRRNPRHLATSSLGTYNGPSFISIGETLKQCDQSDDYNNRMET